MTSTEQLVLFYDILENTNPIFRNTEERPITDVVFQYLNEAQIRLYIIGIFQEICWRILV
jgi:hypothetical protein